MKDTALNCWATSLNFLNRRNFLNQQAGFAKCSYMFNSFFVPKLHGVGRQVYGYQNVATWGSKVPGEDIFGLKKLLIPINHNKNHWVLGCVDMEQEKIVIFDSLRFPTTQQYRQDILYYLENEYRAKNNGRNLPPQWRRPPREEEEEEDMPL